MSDQPSSEQVEPISPRFTLRAERGEQLNAALQFFEFLIDSDHLGTTQHGTRTTSLTGNIRTRVENLAQEIQDELARDEQGEVPSTPPTPAPRKLPPSSVNAVDEQHQQEVALAIPPTPAQRKLPPSIPEASAAPLSHVGLADEDEIGEYNNNPEPNHQSEIDTYIAEQRDVELQVEQTTVKTLVDKILSSQLLRDTVVGVAEGASTGLASGLTSRVLNSGRNEKNPTGQDYDTAEITISQSQSAHVSSTIYPSTSSRSSTTSQRPSTSSLSTTTSQRPSTSSLSTTTSQRPSTSSLSTTTSQRPSTLPTTTSQRPSTLPTTTSQRPSTLPITTSQRPSTSSPPTTSTTKRSTRSRTTSTTARPVLTTKHSTRSRTTSTKNILLDESSSELSEADRSTLEEEREKDRRIIARADTALDRFDY